MKGLFKAYQAKLYTMFVLVLLAFAVQGYSQGLLVEYLFPEGSGTITDNSAGSSYDGILNLPDWTTGINSYGLDFNSGDCDRVEVQGSGGLNFLGNFTLEAWIYRHDNNNEIILCKSWHYKFSTLWDRLCYTSQPGDYCISGATQLSLNEWHHVAVTVKHGDAQQDTLVLYLDGVPDAYSLIGPRTTNESSWLVGAYYDSQNYVECWDGLMDEVRIYNCACTPQQILAHYVQYRKPAIRARYHCGEGIGDYAYDDAGFASNAHLHNVTWTTGTFGSALQFNGTNAYGHVQDTPLLDIDHNLTVDCLIKPGIVPGGNRTIMKKNGLHLYLDVQGRLHNGSTISSNALLQNGSLYRVTYVEDSVYEAIYINGGLDKTEPTQFSGMSGIEPLWIGGGGLGTYYYSGTIDEITIQGQALAARDIKPDTIFYASYNTSTTADFALGERKPATENGINIVDGGIKGKAMFSDDVNDNLGYLEADNLCKTRGTVEFWVKPNWDPEADNPEYFFRPFFWEWWDQNNPQYDAIHIFQAYHEGIFFGLRDENNYAMFANLNRWNKDEWHHIAFTWDNAKGIRAYMDGEYYQFNDFAYYADFTWSPCVYDTFFVGSTNDHVWPANAAIDELVIYNGVLDTREINLHYRKYAPLDFYAQPGVFKQNGGSTLTSIVVINKSDRTVTGTLKCTIGGSIPGYYPINLTPGQYDTVLIGFTPAVLGSHYVKCEWTENVTYVKYERTLRLYVIESGENPSASELDTVEVLGIDCTETLPTDLFCHTEGHQSYVSGNYRESPTAMHSRFAYRVVLGDTIAPYLISVKYPDDKMRTMGIELGTPTYYAQYNIQTGVFTGGEYSTSSGKKKHDILCWPRDTACAIIFTNWLPELPEYYNGGGAAACSIEVYQVLGDEDNGYLPKTTVILPGGEPERLIGLWWEDANLYDVFGGRAPVRNNMPWHNVREFYRSVYNMMDYLHYTGQNLVTYPVYFYTAPHYPSAVEPYNMNGRTPFHTYDWVDMILKACENNDVYFIPSFTMMIMSTLEQMSQYECISVANKLNHIHDVGPDIMEGPLYSPVHPMVQARIYALVDEMLARYGDSPAFKGLSFNLWGNTFLWFGSLNSGYDDYTVALYKMENPSTFIPDFTDQWRFKKRYEWLMNHEKTSWVNWRCDKIYELLNGIRERIQNKKPDAKLVIDAWLPYPSECSDTTHYFSWYDLNQLNPLNPEWLDELYRYAGLELNSYLNTPGFEVEKICRFSKYRERLWQGETPPAASHSREIFFDPSYYEPLVSSINNNTTANAFNCYFEAGISQIPGMAGYFWYNGVQTREPGWRANAIVPGHKYFMEYYSLLMANLDPIRLGIGGLTVGTVGQDSSVTRFVKAYRALPAKTFSDVCATNDFRVKDYHSNVAPETYYYFYFINKDSTSYKVIFTFSKSEQYENVLKDLVDGATWIMPSGQSTYVDTMDVAPYELKSYSVSGPGYVDIISVVKMR